MAFQLLQNGTVYTPEPAGVLDVLLDGVKILKIGKVDPQKLRDALGMEVEVFDAAGLAVVPGLIDPHSHIIGAGGEKGFTSRMPELNFTQVIQGGITTVVGLLGTDTATRYLNMLYAKVGEFRGEGITAYMYTGGFEVPMQTVTGSIVNDLVMIEPVIGIGEIAISDERWLDPRPYDLARVVYESKLGGMISGKAGITHIHTGSEEKRLAPIRDLLNQYSLRPDTLYITHIERSEALMDEAIELAKRGAYVDMDTVEGGIGKWIHYYLDHGGPPDHLTISSDSYTSDGSPARFYQQFMLCMCEQNFSLEQALPFFTANTARVLKLEKKGHLAEELDADVLVVDPHSLDIVHLFALGNPMIRDGKVVKQSQQEKQVEEAKTGQVEKEQKEKSK